MSNRLTGLRDVYDRGAEDMKMETTNNFALPSPTGECESE